MAKKASPSIKLGTVTYNTASCLQVANFNDGVEDLTYRCNGYMKHEGGDRTISLQFSLAVESSDTTKAAAFAPMTTYTTAEFHPYGDVTGNIEHTSSKATVITRNSPSSPGTIALLDVTVVWDDITTGAAA